MIPFENFRIPPEAAAAALSTSIITRLSALHERFGGSFGHRERLISGTIQRGNYFCSFFSLSFPSFLRLWKEGALIDVLSNDLDGLDKLFLFFHCMFGKTFISSFPLRLLQHAGINQMPL